MRITRSGGSSSASFLDMPRVCPTVRGVGLKEGEVEAHCALEIEKLAKSGGVGAGTGAGALVEKRNASKAAGQNRPVAWGVNGL